MAHDTRSASISICHLAGCPSIADQRPQYGATHEVRSDDGLGEQAPRPTSRRAASGPQQREPHPPTIVVARGQPRRSTVGPAAPTPERRRTDRPDSTPSQLSPRSYAAHGVRASGLRTGIALREAGGGRDGTPRAELAGSDRRHRGCVRREGRRPRRRPKAVEVRRQELSTRFSDVLRGRMRVATHWGV